MIILGIIFGIALAVGFTYMMTMILVCNSNVLGDSKGAFNNFAARPLRMISRADGIKPSSYQRMP